MRVPTTNFVSGMMKTIRMMKGTERTTLTTLLRAAKTGPFFKIPSLLVSTRLNASAMPITDPTASDTKIM